MTVSDHLSEFPYSQALGALLLSYLVYGVGLVAYRLYLSPLAKFPGPKLAAATLWYEFYYDVIKRGRFAWEIKRMHEVYGPVVRINPYELHVNVPDFYDELYAGHNRKRNKHPWSADMFSIPGSMLSTVEHDMHRKRRAPIAPYFSLQAIRRFDPVIRKKLDIMCARFEEYQRSGQPVNLDAAFSAFTTDIITEYAFGISYGHLEADDFNPEWVPLLMGASENSLLHKQIPWITDVMRKIPMGLLLKIKPEMGNFVLLQEGIANRIEEIKSGKNKLDPNSDKATIFHDFLSSDLPASELTPERLLGEGQTVVAAGTLTTAHYLKTTMFHILSNASILRKLRAELEEAMPKPSTLPPFKELDGLPYLNAVINEGFRLSHGIIQRLTRIAPDEALQVQGYTIPAGTPIGMSSWLLHLNPELFPSPHDFRPERWLEPGADRLKKYLVNFTKGSRMCLGKDLARTEIAYTISLLVRRWGGDMQLWETSIEDVEIEHDFFNPFPRFESKGVRVVFRDGA